MRGIDGKKVEEMFMDCLLVKEELEEGKPKNWVKWKK